jgi:hypothetical protein
MFLFNSYYLQHFLFNHFEFLVAFEFLFWYALRMCMNKICILLLCTSAQGMHVCVCESIVPVEFSHVAPLPHAISSRPPCTRADSHGRSSWLCVALAERGEFPREFRTPPRDIACKFADSRRRRSEVAALVALSRCLIALHDHEPNFSSVESVAANRHVLRTLAIVRV